MWKIHWQQWEGQINHFLQKIQNGLNAGFSGVPFASFAGESRISQQGIDARETRS